VGWPWVGSSKALAEVRQLALQESNRYERFCCSVMSNFQALFNDCKKMPYSSSSIFDLKSWFQLCHLYFWPVVSFHTQMAHAYTVRHLSLWLAINISCEISQTLNLLLYLTQMYGYFG